MVTGVVNLLIYNSIFDWLGPTWKHHFGEIPSGWSELHLSTESCEPFVLGSMYGISVFIPAELTLKIHHEHVGFIQKKNTVILTLGFSKSHEVKKLTDLLVQLLRRLGVEFCLLSYRGTDQCLRVRLAQNNLRDSVETGRFYGGNLQRAPSHGWSISFHADI